MAISQKLHTKLVQKLILTPSLQQAIKLLPMSTLELKDLLNQEMVENPMLEEIPTEDTQAAEAQTTEEKPEPRSRSRSAPTPGTTRTTSISSASTSTTATVRARRRKSRSCRRSRTRSRRSSSLADHLSWQLSLQTDDSVIREIGEAIIGNLDDDGYLVASLDELAGDGAVAGRAGRAASSRWCRASIRSASPRATCRNACCCRSGTSGSKARPPRASSPSICARCRTIRFRKSRASSGCRSTS